VVGGNGAVNSEDERHPDQQRPGDSMEAQEETEGPSGQWGRLSAPEQVGQRTEVFSEGGDELEEPEEPDEIVVAKKLESAFRKDQIFDRYRLQRRLGTGAFAEVWLAIEDGSHGFRKEVALKLLKKDRADEETLAALLDEARVCGMLHHPHLVDVYGVGISKGVAYIAMEYIRGTTLGDLLSKLKAQELVLPLSVILDIGIQTCQGLDYAHTATDHEGTPLSLVHRDLKPGNLMLSASSGVKVADFGLAKASTTTQSTEVGTLRGTPGYIAPEVWGGSRNFTPAIDLFAVGAILWEMAVGSTLFSGPLPEVIGAAMHGSLDGEIQRLSLHHPALAPVVRGLLQRDPEKRTQSAWELKAALETVRAETPAGGGLDLLLSLVNRQGDEKAQQLTRKNNLEAVKNTEDPRWLKLLDSHGSLFIQLDPSQVERRVRPRRPIPVPGPTRKMKMDNEPALAALALQSDKVEAPSPVPTEEQPQDEAASQGTLWRAEIPARSGMSRRTGGLLGLAALMAIGLSIGLSIILLSGRGSEEDTSPSAENDTTGEQAETAPEPQKAPTDSSPEKAVAGPVPSKAVAKAVAGPVASKAVAKTVASKAVAKAVASKAVAGPVASKAVAEPVASKAVAKAVASKAVAGPVPSKAVAEAPKTAATTVPERGCLVFRSAPAGMKVLLNSKDAGRVASPRSKPLLLPSGVVMVHMEAGFDLKLSTEVRVRDGKRTTVNCNFSTSRCSVMVSDEACQ